MFPSVDRITEGFCIIIELLSADAGFAVFTAQLFIVGMLWLMQLVLHLTLIRGCSLIDLRNEFILAPHKLELFELLFALKKLLTRYELRAWYSLAILQSGNPFFLVDISWFAFLALLNCASLIPRDSVTILITNLIFLVARCVSITSFVYLKIVLFRSICWLVDYGLYGLWINITFYIITITWFFH